MAKTTGMIILSYVATYSVAASSKEKALTITPRVLVDFDQLDNNNKQHHPLITSQHQKQDKISRPLCGT